MRLLVHDYSGHPFQAELSRALARRGHEVDHTHCASYVSGKGRLHVSPSDPATLTFTAIPLGSDFAKYQFVKRIGQEIQYAWLFVSHVRKVRPDVVLMCNTPLLANFLISVWMLLARQRSVFWHQDVYSRAIALELRRRVPIVSSVLALAADKMERFVAAQARQVIVIAETFLPVHDRWGTPRDKVTVQPNWAPVADIPCLPKVGNRWAAGHGLAGRPVVLYSGTVGLKHDVEIFGAFQELLQARLGDCALVVVTSGEAAAHLRDSAPGILVLPFQEFAVLPEVFASADVLLTILEADASDFSVPSKTLSYLCAGRPVLALVPHSNPAFAIVRDAGGLPFDVATSRLSDIADEVARLLLDEEELRRRGAQARSYAEKVFDVESITDVFEGVLKAAHH